MPDTWVATNDHLNSLGDLFWKQAGKTFKGCLASGFAGTKASAASVFLAAELTTSGYVRGDVLVGGAAIGAGFTTAFDTGQDRAECPQLSTTITAGSNSLTYNCFFILQEPDNKVVLFFILSSPETIPASKPRQFLINYNLGGGNTPDVEAP